MLAKVYVAATDLWVVFFLCQIEQMKLETGAAACGKRGVSLARMQGDGVSGMWLGTVCVRPGKAGLPLFFLKTTSNDSCCPS